MGLLESFALDPPRFGIQWKTASKAFEFRMGSKLQDGTGYYFTIDRTHVYVAQGPALNMLDLITSIQFLRKKTWTTLTPDDIDEVELRHLGKPILYAQREGDRWTDKNHRLVRKDIETLLNGAINAQTQKMIDDPKQATQLKKQIQDHSLSLTKPI